MKEVAGDKTCGVGDNIGRLLPIQGLPQPPHASLSPPFALDPLPQEWQSSGSLYPGAATVVWAADSDFSLGSGRPFHPTFLFCTRPPPLFSPGKFARQRNGQSKLCLLTRRPDRIQQYIMSENAETTSSTPSPASPTMHLRPTVDPAPRSSARDETARELPRTNGVVLRHPRVRTRPKYVFLLY